MLGIGTSARCLIPDTQEVLRFTANNSDRWREPCRIPRNELHSQSRHGHPLGGIRGLRIGTAIACDQDPAGAGQCCEAATSESGSLPAGGTASFSSSWRTPRIKVSLAGCQGTIAGPRVSPVRAPRRESSRKPLMTSFVTEEWHVWQLVASSGRIFFSKNSGPPSACIGEQATRASGRGHPTGGARNRRNSFTIKTLAEHVLPPSCVREPSHAPRNMDLSQRAEPARTAPSPGNPARRRGQGTAVQSNPRCHLGFDCPYLCYPCSQLARRTQTAGRERVPTCCSSSATPIGGEQCRSHERPPSRRPASAAFRHKGCLLIGTT